MPAQRRRPAGAPGAQPFQQGRCPVLPPPVPLPQRLRARSSRAPHAAQLGLMCVVVAQQTTGLSSRVLSTVLVIHSTRQPAGGRRWRRTPVMGRPGAGEQACHAQCARQLRVRRPQQLGTARTPAARAGSSAPLTQLGGEAAVAGAPGAEVLAAPGGVQPGEGGTGGVGGAIQKVELACGGAANGRSVGAW